LASNHGCSVHNHDDRPSGIRVDVDEAVEPDVEARLLARLPNPRDGDFFPTLALPPRKHPKAVAWLDRTTDEDNFFVGCDDHRSHGDLRIEVVNVPPAGADRPDRGAPPQV